MTADEVPARFTFTFTPPSFLCFGESIIRNETGGAIEIHMPEPSSTPGVYVLRLAPEALARIDRMHDALEQVEVMLSGLSFLGLEDDESARVLGVVREALGERS